MSRIRRSPKRILIAAGGVLVVASLLVCRYQHRTNDALSCEDQVQDRVSIEVANTHRTFASQDQYGALINTYQDECMKSRGHDYIGGSEYSCAKYREISCYGWP